jgi:para-aminobenzoate synthetase component 1
MPFELPFTIGYVGFLPYKPSEDKCSAANTLSAAKIFEVFQTIVWDREAGETYLCGAPRRDAEFDISSACSDILNRLTEQESPASALAVPGIELVPCQEKSNYLALVKQALADIRNGRYYQINLLRYFKVPVSPTRSAIAARIRRVGGPFSSLLSIPGLTIASFSPERFVQIQKSELGTEIATEPIKGTIGRSANPEVDQRRAAELVASKKDNTELHIIIDLLRNDLNRVCKRGSVRVQSSGTLMTFPTVHHLVANVQGILADDVTYETLFSNILPGGSITGAPKREVMAAIREYEGCDRGYFMGISFLADQGGRFDSAILIRTLHGDKNGNFTYAAGSGITIASEAWREYEEIGEKCRVVSDPLPSL